MKKVYLILASFFFVTVYAQKKIDCSPKIKQYQAFLEASKLDEAYEPWSFVKKSCPKGNETVYTDGVKILLHKIEATDKERKEFSVRELMALYDQYYKYFQNSVQDYEVKKAMLLYDNKVGTVEEIHNLVDSGVSKAMDVTERITALNLYMEIYYSKYSKQDKTVTKNVLIDKFEKVNSRFHQLEEQYPDKALDYKIASRSLQNRFKNDITCEDFVPRVTKDFDQNKKNIDWLTNALHNMAGKCLGSDIYYQTAQTLYDLKPSAFSAHQLAQSSVKQRKVEDAKKYYLQSIELEKNPEEKAKTYYLLATLETENIALLKQNMEKALLFDPKMARAYLYLAQIYSSNADKCGTTSFEKKAVNYLAYKTVLKAGEIDEKFKPSAESVAKKYLESAPTKEEIAAQNLQGKEYTIGCDINETITFPEN
jgi:tetratricopeptide (TPR) repeat protein